MADVSSPPTWTEQARSIHDFVCQARYSTSSNGATELGRQLSVYLPLFINLLDDAPKNTKDRQQLQSGTALIHGVERKVSAEFIRETIFLSDQLDINEWVAATLLTCGKITSSRTGASAIDTSVLLYYDEQVYLLAALDVILASIKDDSVKDDIRSVFHQFTLELMDTEVTGTTGSFVTKLLQANNDLRKQIGTVTQNGGMVINNGTISNSNSTATTSATTTISATGGILGEDIITKRLDRMTDERIYIVQIVYHLASLTRLSQDDIFSMLELLQLSDLTDVTTPYLMIALLSTISPVGSDEDEMAVDDCLLSDVNFINFFHSKLLGNLFKVPAIKAVVALQWCLFVTRARALYEQVAEFTKVSEEVIEQLSYGAIGTRAFLFLNDYILYFQQPSSKLDSNRHLLKISVIEEMQDTMYDIAIDPTDFTKFNADIRQDFHPFVLFELEKLVLGIIENMGEILQKLRYRDEDNATPVRSHHSPSNNTTQEDNNEEFKDTEHFFDLLASVYRGRPNKGVIFWAPDNNSLYSFIQRTTDIKVPATVGACYDFFGSISTGDQCATLAYDFFNTDHTISSSLILWGKLFATLQFYGPLLRNATGESSVMLPPAEERLLIKFLYLLQQVVLYSAKARQEMWKDKKLKVLDSIMEVLKYTNSTDLRASLYDTLAAFCTSWGGGAIDHYGATISLQVWGVLERSNDFVISKNRTLTDSSLVAALDKQPRIMQHLERERGLLVYPQTLSVLRLFGSAIHTQSKRDELLSGFKPIPSTLPASLGQETRTPGARPYISLVINDIFPRLPSQNYKYPGEKWQLSSAALRVLENSLLSFDLQQLEELTAAKNKKKSGMAYLKNRLNKGNEPTESAQLQNLLLQYVTHPGYSVMIETLSGGHFCKQLLQIIEHGVDGVTNKNDYGPYFIECIVRSLRIVYRVLQIQSSFCNVLVPHLTGLSNRSATAEFTINGFKFDALPTLVPLGQHLLCQANIIVQIAMLMNCEDHEEICYLSTKILDALSTDTKHDNAIKKGFEYAGAYAPMGGLGSRLATVLDACKDAPSIVYGVGERLEIGQPETISYDDYFYDINNILFWKATKTLQDTYNYDDDPSWLHRTSSVRVAILDLLLENATVDQTSPTLTEFFLGYMALNKIDTGFIQRQDSDSLSIVFGSIMDMMQTRDDDGMDIVEDSRILSDRQASLIETHPILAEKCYQLVYRLCAKESTSTKTLRHLRNEEEFFVKQFKALPARLGTIAAVENPTFPGDMVCPDGSVIQTDFFRLLSMLHQRAWLLKSLALELHYTSGMQQKSQVVKLLNLLFGQQLDTTDSAVTHTMPPGTFEQDLVKILEIASSLEFRWDDGLVKNKAEFTPPIVFFADFVANDYQILNERQCLVYDIRTIHSKLHELKLDRQKHVLDEHEAMEFEMKNILQSLVVENHVREIIHGRVHCLRAWKQVVQVAMTECFHYFPTESRQPIIYALLMAILPKMLPSEGFDTGILKALSELVSTLLIQLRGRNEAPLESLLPSRTTYGLPDDKVVQLFVSIIDTIQEGSTIVPVRGDMYTALVNLLQYIQQSHPNESLKATSVEKRLVELLSNRYETVLNTICNDACDGLGIWRTTAFTLLNALYNLTNHVDDTIFLSLLVKRNFLRYSVDMIRNDNSAMMAILVKEDESLLPMYIYEVKISLFISVASKRKGAEILVESGVLDVLGHCEFINQRPKSSTNKDLDKTLMERYDQVLVPTLRLIVTLLYSIGRENQLLLELVEGWVAKQQESLIHILQCDNDNITVAFLKELKFVVTIMYYLSCRPGYFDNLLSRNLNHLHVLLIKLNHQWNSDNILNKMIPENDEERMWSNQQVSGPQATSIFVNKSNKLVHVIQRYIQAYEHNAKAETM